MSKRSMMMVKLEISNMQHHVEQFCLPNNKKNQIKTTNIEKGEFTKMISSEIN